MILEGYGVKLERLKADDLELIRLKRNSEEVKPFMRYRDEITPEMQRAWFVRIDNANNNYFVIVHEGRKIGLISGAEIDWNTMETRNGGLFIWESSLWGTPVPLSAALLLTELSFRIGFVKTYVRVLPSNKRALNFNAELGYARCSTQPGDELEIHELNAEQFFAATEKLRSTLKRQYPKLLECVIDDAHHPASKQVIAAYAKLNDEEKSRFSFTVNTSL